MAVQISEAVRNARLNAIESTVGTSPTLNIYDNVGMPEDCSASALGTLLVSITLPSDWLQSASEGNISGNNPWSGTVLAGGTASYFRILSGATCHLQGNISQVGYGGDLTLENTELVLSDEIVIASFMLTEANS